MMKKSLPLLVAMLVAASVTALAQRPQPEPAGQFVTVNGHRLWYRSVGQGTPLLLIPGGPGISHTYLYPSFDRFADKFRVIYFDAFGRGKSDRARTPGEYSFQHDVDEVEGLRKAIGLDRIVVYGHSSTTPRTSRSRISCRTSGPIFSSCARRA